MPQKRQVSWDFRAAFVLFDWALILFSTIAGADWITSNLHVPPKGAAIIFIVLAIFGIFVLATMFSRHRRAVA